MHKKDSFLNRIRSYTYLVINGDLEMQASLRSECESDPMFESGTAYARTKIACRLLLRRGEPIPSWMAIRDIIGKGSSGDITRGIKDFRQEHAQQLSRLESVAGIPEHLAHQVRSLWDCALVCAGQSFEDQAQDLRQKAEQAQALADQAAHKLLMAQGVIESQAAQIEALGARLGAAEHEARSEQGARRQAERMFEQQLTEISGQRTRLEETLREHQMEMQKTLERFDGERRYAMLQIEEARSKSASELAALKASAQREKSALDLQIAKLERSAGELRLELDEARKQATQFERDCLVVQSALKALQADYARLSDDHRRALAALKKSGVRKVARF